MRAISAALLSLSLAACVPYPGEAPVVDDRPQQPEISGTFPDLDAGASDLESLHFKIRASAPDIARQTADSAEESYNRIMVDTNLFSFRPSGLYKVVIYGSLEEYRRKTGQPSWSGGVSVGNSIYTYPGPRIGQTIAHEMTHLIFFEFMGRANIDHRWVNEGLAVYEESKAAGSLGHGGIFAALQGNLRQAPIPMDQMIRLAPATEREYTVSVWYAQSESMIRYMIERGGRMGFSQFLTMLRDGRGFDEAVGQSFPGAWRNLDDFYRQWQRSAL